jgi:hypothetical protein
MTASLMQSRPGHLVFAAAELLHGHEGMLGGAPPSTFLSHLRPDDDISTVSRTWAGRVLVPVIFHLLRPRITLDVTLDFEPVGLPYRIVEIDGKGPHSYGRQAALRDLAPFTLTLTLDAVANLWRHGQTLREAGVPQEHATLALTAGLTPDETRARWADGTLDLDALRLLHALARPDGAK